MMRDVEKTIGNMIDKMKFAVISYIDDEGFPVSKAMLPPREREGIKIFLAYNQHIFKQSEVF